MQAQDKLVLRVLLACLHIAWINNLPQGKKKEMLQYANTHNTYIYTYICMHICIHVCECINILCLLNSCCLYNNQEYLVNQQQKQQKQQQQKCK